MMHRVDQSKKVRYIVIFVAILMLTLLVTANQAEKAQANEPTKISTEYAAQQFLQQQRNLALNDKQAELQTKIDAAYQKGNLGILENYLKGLLASTFTQTPDDQRQYADSAVKVMATLFMLSSLVNRYPQIDSAVNAQVNTAKIMAANASYSVYATQSQYNYEPTSGEVDTTKKLFGAEYYPRLGQDNSAGITTNQVETIQNPNSNVPHLYLKTVRTIPRVKPWDGVFNNNNYDRLSNMSLRYQTGYHIGSISTSDPGAFYTGYIRASNGNSPWRDGQVVMSGYMPQSANLLIDPLLTAYGDYQKGNYGAHVQVSLPDGVDAAAFLKSLDWNQTGASDTFIPSSAFLGNLADPIYALINGVLGAFNLGILSFPLQFYPEYAGVDAKDPSKIYLPIGGVKLTDSWQPSKMNDHIPIASIQAAVTNLKNSLTKITGFIESINIPMLQDLIKPLIDAIKGSLDVFNGITGAAGTAWGVAWQVFNNTLLRILFPLGMTGIFNLNGIVSGWAKFDMTRYSGNWSTDEINANQTYFPDNSKTKSNYLAAADDSPNKVLTRGSLPPNYNNKWGQHYRAYMHDDMRAPKMYLATTFHQGWYMAAVNDNASGSLVDAKDQQDLSTWSSYFSPIDHVTQARDADSQNPLTRLYDPLKSFNIKQQKDNNGQYKNDPTTGEAEFQEADQQWVTTGTGWDFLHGDRIYGRYDPLDTGDMALDGPNFYTRRVDMTYDSKTPKTFTQIDGWNGKSSDSASVQTNSENQKRFFRVIDFFNHADITNDKSTALLPLTADADHDPTEIANNQVGFVKSDQFVPFMNTHFNQDVKVYYNASARSSQDFKGNTNSSSYVQNGNVVNGSFITVNQHVEPPKLNWARTPETNTAVDTTIHFAGTIYSQNAWQANMQYRIVPDDKDINKVNWGPFDDGRFGYGTVAVSDNQGWRALKKRDVPNYGYSNYVHQALLWRKLSTDEKGFPLNDSTLNHGPLGSDPSQTANDQTITWDLPYNVAKNTGRYIIQIRAVDNFGASSNILEHTFQVGDGASVKLVDQVDGPPVSKLYYQNGAKQFPVDRTGIFVRLPWNISFFGAPTMDPYNYLLQRDDRYNVSVYPKLIHDYELAYVTVAEGENSTNSGFYAKVGSTTITSDQMPAYHFKASDVLTSGRVTFTLPASKNYTVTYHYKPITLALNVPTEINYGIRAKPHTDIWQYAPTKLARNNASNKLQVVTNGGNDSTWILNAKASQLKPEKSENPLLTTGEAYFIYYHMVHGLNNTVNQEALQLSRSLNPIISPGDKNGQDVINQSYTVSATAGGGYIYDISDSWYTVPASRRGNDVLADDKTSLVLQVYNPANNIKVDKYQGTIDWQLDNSVE
ncbi:hypothetical protein ACNAN0_11255 [Agrilactobacillus fermenti]|uniref:hypothetical protein n=1 Tax=Agrilactobacillus fermenti TaxID=2586909 RepID=UPI003A5C325B